MPAAEMPARPPAYFAIFAAMRTGSNLLEKSLELYDGIKTYGELFNPAFIGKAGRETFQGVTLEERERRPEAVLAAMHADSAGATPGFRIFDGHDTRIEERCIADPDCAKIVLERDPLESYVSLKTARATDQWMLGQVSRRKSARTEFAADEFRAYLGEIRGYYARIRRKLKISGQTAFFLNYRDVLDADVVAGLARHLGAAMRRKPGRVRIRRQNPEAMSDRVENFEFMRRVVSEMGISPREMPFDDEPERGPAVRRMVASETLPLLVAVVPGCPAPGLLRWMRGGAAGKGAAEPPPRRFSDQKELHEWLSANPGFVCLSVVRHPVARAYDVFMRRIFEGGYPAIRERLCRHFGLDIPPADQVRAGRDSLLGTGYSAARHRDAFLAYLEFVRANLSGQTGIRTDPDWASQTAHLEGFCKAVPPSNILHEADVPREIARLARKWGVEARPEAAEGPGEPEFAGLHEIYDEKIERLARRAYAKDYVKLGFGDFGGGG